MKYATHKWVTVENLIMTFTSAGEIGQADWDGFMAALDSPNITRYLGMSRGLIGVNSLKRKQGSEILNRRKISSAIVTDERFVRGLVTAVSWLGVDMKAFSWAELRLALRHLGMERIEDQIIKIVDEEKRFMFP